LKSHNYSGSGFKVHGSRFRTIIIIFLMVFLPLASSGKIFWSRLLTKSASGADQAWRQIYKCPMTVNGARAFLTVYGSDDPVQSVTAKLKESANSNRGTGAVQNKAAGLLPAGMPGKDQTIIFELSPPPDKLAKPPTPPAESVVFGRTLPAGSRLTTVINNEETGATLETLITDLPPDRVMHELSGYLSRNEWKNISPAADHDAPAGHFLIFQRKDALCIITAGQAAARTGQSLRENKTYVTILFKEKNVN